METMPSTTRRNCRQPQGPPASTSLPRVLVVTFVGSQAHGDVVREPMLQGRNAVMFLQHLIRHPGIINPPCTSHHPGQPRWYEEGR